jgi:uncharacterized protein YcbK (DUF882 family)
MLNCDRRELLLGGLATAGSLLLPKLCLAARDRHKDVEARTLSFYNTHTGKRGTFTYWEKGEYLTIEMKEINYFLRDWRDNTVHKIDESLLDQLYLLHYFTESNKPFEVISGYRSPKTNAMLFKNTEGVKKDSYHMQGRAIDIRLGDVRLANLHKAALDLKAGGVGYYPQSNFIHVDSGALRKWEFRG